jgi:hypothetical protein
VGTDKKTDSERLNGWNRATRLTGSAYLTTLRQLNPDSAVQLKGWKRGAILEQRRRPTLQFQRLFGLSQVVAINLNIRSQHRRSMSAQRHKPIDFAAEGLRLALAVDRNCGIRVEPSIKNGLLSPY